MVNGILDKFCGVFSIINPELEYDFELRTYYVLLIEIVFVHVFHYALFTYVANYYLIMWNIVSIILYIMAFALLKKKLISSLFIVVHFEVLAYVIFSNYIIGWEPYIALTIFDLLVALIFDPFKRNISKHILALVEIIVLTVLVITSSDSSSAVMPIADIGVLNIVRVLNVFACAIGIYAMVAISRLSHKEAYREMEKKYSLIKNEKRIDPVSRVLCKDYVIGELSTIHNLYRYSSLSYVVFICKIDSYESIEEKHGLEVSNKVLFDVASIISASVRSNDLVARWDCDKFLIALNNSKINTAIVVAEKIREAIDNYTYVGEDNTFDVTASFGVAESKRKYDVMDTVETAIKFVDSPKYRGKNTVIY